MGAKEIKKKNWFKLKYKMEFNSVCMNGRTLDYYQDGEES